MKWANLPFRMESKLVRWVYRRTGQRPSSAPYLSGDGFRSLTSWRYEGPEKPSFVLESIEPGALIFCDAWHLETFFTDIATRIPTEFSVVSHNGDPNFAQDRVISLPAKLLRLFSQNALAEDSRVVPLPIGLENKCFHYNGVTKDFDRLRQQSPPQLNRILYAFTVGTNQKVREPALASLERNPLADGLARINSRSYRKIASHYRFIASPPGNGEDCHRTWEALYLRAVPIVIRSSLTKHFRSLGLPLWLVDSFDEIDGLSEDDLDQKYRELSQQFDHPALWMDYWEKQILAKIGPT